MRRGDAYAVSVCANELERRAPVVASPGPGVAEPQLRYEVERRGIGAAVHRGHREQDVVRGRFGVGDRNVEEAVLGQDPCVGELVLSLVAATPGVLGQQLLVRESGLRVPVEQLPP